MKIRWFPMKLHHFVRMKAGGPHLLSHPPLHSSPNPLAISNQSTVALADSSGLKWGFGSREVKYKLKLSWIRVGSVQIHDRTKRICKNPSKSAQIGQLNSAVKLAEYYQRLLKTVWTFLAWYSGGNWITRFSFPPNKGVCGALLYSPNFQPAVSSHAKLGYLVVHVLITDIDVLVLSLGLRKIQMSAATRSAMFKTFHSYSTLCQSDKIAWLVAVQDHKIPISFESLHLILQYASP